LDEVITWDTPLNNGWAGDTVLHIACEHGHVEVIERLLKESRLYLGAKNSRGNTALHIACEHGHVEVVERLLKESRLYLGAKDSGGEMAFQVAVKKVRWGGVRRLQVLTLFLGDQRVDVNEMDDRDMTLLHRTRVRFI
jgi:ankyrin repeat protein